MTNFRLNLVKKNYVNDIFTFIVLTSATAKTSIH